MQIPPQLLLEADQRAILETEARTYQREREQFWPATEVFCDGGVVDHNPSTFAGTWACCFIDEQGHRIGSASGLVIAARFASIAQKRSERLLRSCDHLALSDLQEISNNVTEFEAVLQALLRLPDRWCGTIWSDSKITLGRVFDSFRLAGIGPAAARAMARNRGRLGALEGKLLAGHPSLADLAAGFKKKKYPQPDGTLREESFQVSAHNVWCDRECARLASLFSTVILGIIDTTNNGVQQ